jgi:phosphoribosylformylglycinamidine cyclo-ligase
VRAALGLNDSDASRERLEGPAPFDATQSLADALLRPHRSYRAAVQRLLAVDAVHGMAHITGGGLPGNVSRIIPEGLVAEIDRSAWNVPPMFDYVAEAGHIAEDECYRAFNMGMGFVVAIAPERLDDVRSQVQESVVIGRVRSASNADSERVALLERRTGHR